jgi:hypothetical protein
MRCWILIQIWTLFALQTPQDALGSSFVGYRRVSTLAAKDNQPEWIAAGSAALSRSEWASDGFGNPPPLFSVRDPR